jgi:type I restriction enzyme R subunit
VDREQIRRRNLPHWDVPGAPYFVTTCLDGGIPAQGLLEIAKHRREIDVQPRPESMSVMEWKVQCWKKSFVRVEEWLDLRSANRALEDPTLASIVVNAIHHFADGRYDLCAYVVMPSHYHWLFQPKEEWIKTPKNEGRSPRERITYSVNRYTATQCNKYLKQKGSFWQKESFDHWARDVEELERIMRYVEENPVKAGLVAAPEDWPFSSARVRKQLGLEWGVPIPGVKVKV